MSNIFKPILFSTPMVEAILEGRKTQTRRVVKFPAKSTTHQISVGKGNTPITENFSKIKKGDILWVRETWQYNDSLTDPYLYKQKYEDEYLKEYHSEMKWKPSIFLPKEAARIFLEVTNVRSERLMDISESDAIAEGIRNFIDEDDVHQFYIYPIAKDKIRTIAGLASLCNTFISKGIFKIENPARFSFQSLWESINGIDSWEANPWVWVYEFRVIDKPKTFNT